MKRSERNPIEVVNGLDFREKTMVITQGAQGFGLQVCLDGTGAVMVASCASADKLGRWRSKRARKKSGTITQHKEITSENQTRRSDRSDFLRR